MAKRKGQKPKYRLTGRSRGGTNRENWVRCGAAWEAFSQDTGVPYIAIRVEAIPVDFDGVMALHEIVYDDDENGEDGNGKDDDE